MADDLLVFDLGNVILDIDFARFADPLGELGGPAASLILERFAQGPAKRAMDTGRVGPRDFLAAIREQVGVDRVSLEEIRLAWCRIFSRNDPAADWLGESDSDQELWLFSDTDPVHFAWVMEAFPEVRRFDRHLLSFVAGRLKRDSGAFDPLRAEVEAGRTVWFFDDLQINVDAAAEAGARSVLVRSWDDVTRALAGV